ncbi:STAS domain-containing protein [Actinomadura sp. B10D3]|uniref:STAS domain-containing protein n=1 Tax=Actinomadura sp. B10D3 TaxID=3153557 RepID=UPI00325E595C
MPPGPGGPSGAAPIDPLHLRSGARGPCLLVEAEGELTILTSDQLREHALAAMRDHDGPPLVVLDVGEVSFCDSSGLNAMIILWKAAHQAGGELVLARPRRRFQTIIERSGLDRHLVAYPTTDEAVEALGSR